MRRLVAVCVVVLALCGSVAFAADSAVPRSKLRVLYVGGSANWDKEQFATPAEMEKDVARRTESFREMLSRYFDKVTVMPAAEYRQEHSEKFDVTVMDGTPEPVEPRRQIKNAAGRVTEVVAARYFTEDFDRPVVVIGELGEKLGRRIGLKFDWYCLCLDAHAHGIRTGHSIFKGPFPVKLTMEERPTPEDAFHYAYYFDDPVPKSLPMWRVQTKGYQTDRNFRIGMVARPWGFEDSPDAEYISSGVCQKGLDAVAIGRHGNFLAWGFAASPEYLTPEAQTVLANAICYIVGFDGQGLLARKYHDRRATKHWVKELKYLATREAYEARVESNRKHGERMAKYKVEAEARQAKGERLSMMEDISLKYRHSPEGSFEEFLASNRSNRHLYDKHGTDLAAYAKYYDDNYPWFYSEAPFYKLTVDEDVKSLGIPNTDVRLLERAIGLWEKGSDVEKAKRILSRYTLLDYPTAAQWRQWFDANRSRLFFTETGGFVFMVNTRDPKVDGNDYARKAESIAKAAVVTAATDDQNPVSVAAGLGTTAGGGRQIVVKFKVHPGYHIYSHVAPGDAFTPTRLKLDLPPGYRAEGPMSEPSHRPYNDAGTTGIFTDEVAFTQSISGSGAGEARIKVEFQCCDSHVCLPPAEHELRVKLE